MAQLNLLIEMIGDRLKKDSVNHAAFMRMAVVAALDKDGAEAFQRMVEETFSESSILRVTTEDLTKFGMGKK